MVDTIMVVEDVQGLVWGDWYVHPEVGRHVDAAIEKEGKLSGRTWLESGAPISALALGRLTAGGQELTFADKGVALGFWQPGEVQYHYTFEGPWGLRARGIARWEESGEERRLVILLPVAQPPDEMQLDARRRVGRLDVAYRSSSREGGIPRGQFTIYLYYLNPRLGYRIVGVGY